MSGITGPGGQEDVLAALRSGRLQGGDARLRAACALLEGSFYQELFKAMRATVPSGSGGNDREMFEGLLDQRLADSAAGRSDRGIGAALHRELARVVPGGPDSDGTPSGA